MVSLGEEIQQKYLGAISLLVASLTEEGSGGRASKAEATERIRLGEKLAHNINIH